MKIQNVNSNVSIGRRRVQADPITSYEFEQYKKRQILPVPEKYQNIDADYAVVDTFRDKNGRVIKRKISFINSEKIFDTGRGAYLNDIV